MVVLFIVIFCYKYKNTGSAAATQVLYLVLSHQESSKAYNKGIVNMALLLSLLMIHSLDDLWIVSSDTDFTPINSFVARSTFYGPTSGLHLEVCPVRWVCHMTSSDHT